MAMNTALATVISKDLLGNLAPAFAANYELDTEDVQKFLRDYLTKHLGSKGVGKATPKGVKGPGRKTGFLLFSNENRESVKGELSDELAELSNKEKMGTIGKALGARWKELSDGERTEYNDRAKAENAQNGIVSKADQKAAAEKPKKVVEKPKKVAEKPKKEPSGKVKSSTKTGKTKTSTSKSKTSSTKKSSSKSKKPKVENDDE